MGQHDDLVTGDARDVLVMRILRDLDVVRPGISSWRGERSGIKEGREGMVIRISGAGKCRRGWTTLFALSVGVTGWSGKGVDGGQLTYPVDLWVVGTYMLAPRFWSALMMSLPLA